MAEILVYCDDHHDRVDLTLVRIVDGRVESASVPPNWAILGRRPGTVWSAWDVARITCPKCTRDAQPRLRRFRELIEELLRHGEAQLSLRGLERIDSTRS